MTSLPYFVARILGRVAEHTALALGVPMVTAIADHEGSLLFFGRMDGALPVSRELAPAKAYTAAALKMPTHEVGRLAQPGGMLYGIQDTHPGRIVLFGGGLPLKLDNAVVGAVGVSGGTVEEDLQVAEPVVKALKEMEELSRLIQGALPADLDAFVLRKLIKAFWKECAAMVGQTWRSDWEPIIAGAFHLASAKSRNVIA